MKLISTSTK